MAQRGLLRSEDRVGAQDTLRDQWIVVLSFLMMMGRLGRRCVGRHGRAGDFWHRPSSQLRAPCIASHATSRVAGHRGATIVRTATSDGAEPGSGGSGRPSWESMRTNYVVSRGG